MDNLNPKLPSSPSSSSSFSPSSGQSASNAIVQANAKLVNPSDVINLSGVTNINSNSNSKTDALVQADVKYVQPLARIPLGNKELALLEANKYKFGIYGIIRSLEQLYTGLSLYIGKSTGFSGRTKSHVNGPSNSRLKEELNDLTRPEFSLFIWFVGNPKFLTKIETDILTYCRTFFDWARDNYNAFTVQTHCVPYWFTPDLKDLIPLVHSELTKYKRQLNKQLRTFKCGLVVETPDGQRITEVIGPSQLVDYLGIPADIPASERLYQAIMLVKDLVSIGDIITLTTPFTYKGVSYTQIRLVEGSIPLPVSARRTPTKSPASEPKGRVLQQPATSVEGVGPFFKAGTLQSIGLNGAKYIVNQLKIFDSSSTNPVVAGIVGVWSSKAGKVLYLAFVDVLAGVKGLVTNYKDYDCLANQASEQLTIYIVALCPAEWVDTFLSYYVLDMDSKNLYNPRVLPLPPVFSDEQMKLNCVVRNQRHEIIGYYETWEEVSVKYGVNLSTLLDYRSFAGGTEQDRKLGTLYGGLFRFEEQGARPAHDVEFDSTSDDSVDLDS